MKAKITLTKEQETLLIPLYAKAQPNPIFVDEKASQILQRVQYDFSQLKIPKKTELTLRMRAKQIDICIDLPAARYPLAVRRSNV